LFSLNDYAWFGSPPLADFIKSKSVENRITRGAIIERIVAIIPHRKTLFGQAVFSYKASHQ